jgi:hypothetical protein
MSYLQIGAGDVCEYLHVFWAQGILCGLASAQDETEPGGPA